MTISNFANSKKNAEIRLSYYKQGEDLKACKILNDSGKVDVAATIDKHIELLQAAVFQLNEIRQVYLSMNPKNVVLDGEKHFISISGPTHFINTLIKSDLASKDPFDSSTESDDEVSEKAEDAYVKNIMSNLITQNYNNFSEDVEPETCVASELIHNKLHTQKQKQKLHFKLINVN